MPTINVKLQDGSIQPMSYPDGWSPDQVKAAIYQHFPPQEKQKKAEEPKTGFRGIGQDIESSFESLPDAFAEMISSIPGGIENFGKYVTTTNPVSTFANLGAGAVESGAGLLSAPQVLMRKLVEKFPQFGEALQRGAMPGSKGINEPTLYESLMNFEKEHGLGAQSPEEGSVRTGGGLIFGGGALKKLPGILSRAGTISAEQAGRGGDPIHAALLSLFGEKLLGHAGKTASKIPDAVNEAARIEPTLPPSPPPSGAASATPAIPQTGINWNVQLPESISWMKNIPQATLNVAKEVPEVAKRAANKIPELALNATASGLETAADIGSKMKIPGLQPTVGAIASYIKHLSVPPEEMAQRKLFGDIKSSDLPRIIQRNEAAKRVGLDYLTPAEATLRPREGAKQGTVGRTTGGLDLLNEKGESRTASEVRAVNNFLDKIYNDDELASEKNAAYEETMTGRVPHEFIKKHSARPVIDEAIAKIQKNSSYRQMIEDELGVPLDKVDPKTFKYWDIVKRVLGDMEESKKDKMGRATTESSEIGKTRRTMVKEMDTIKPEYETARNISERKYTRQKVEDAFDKKPMTLNNLHTFLKSRKNYEHLVRKLEGLPEARSMLDDLHLLSGDLIPNDINIRTAAALKRTGMSDSRNKLDAAKRDLDERFGQAHDVAAVELMTHPEWVNILTEYLKKNRK